MTNTIDLNKVLASEIKLLELAKKANLTEEVINHTNEIARLTAELNKVEETTYLVAVRNKETNEVSVKEYKAVSAKKAKEDFQDNGYAVRFVATEETFDAECEAYNAKIEKQVQKRAIMKEVRAQYA